MPQRAAMASATASVTRPMTGPADPAAAIATSPSAPVPSRTSCAPTGTTARAAMATTPATIADPQLPAAPATAATAAGPSVGDDDEQAR